MDPERWRKIEALYEAALAAEPARRAGFLEENCAGDESLKSEVESLLVHGENAGRFLNVPPREKQPEVGSRVSHYEIEEKVGEGGMGVVYKARDTRLGRSVALKFVKAQFSERFEREARAIAALNHPHIATLHDVGEHEGAPYLAMEFVEGQPLKGPRPVKEVFEYGIQLADALAAAHGAGIVHRDLKPANILVTAKGSVKVLDFGLAKLRAQIGDATPASATLTGISAGTPGYMSPEQIDGKPGDSRSDIFAYGCLLYELASGRHAFEGDSVGKVLAATTTTEPKPLDGIPEQLDELIRRCLRKDPERRLHHIADARIALEDMRDAPAPVRQAKPRARLRVLPILAAFLLGIALLTFATVAWLRDGRGVDLAGYKPTPFATEAEPESRGLWSPDGTSIAYLQRIGRRNQLMLRSLSAPTPIQLTRLADGVIYPFWSPDGNRIYFLSPPQPVGLASLWSIGVAGGEPQQILADRILAACLSPDGKSLVFWKAVEQGGKRTCSLWVSSPPGASPRKYQPAPFEVFGLYVPTYLRFSPDGSRIGLSTWQAPAEVAEFWLLPWPDGPNAKPQRLFRNRTFTSPPAFDWMPDSRHFVMSDLGSLWLADATTQALSRLTAPPSTVGYGLPSVSPDGRRIVVDVASRDLNIVEVPLDGSPIRPVIATARNEFSPSWSRFGDRMAYITDRSGELEIWLRSAKGDWESPIVTSKDFPNKGSLPLRAAVLSPDGSRVAFLLARELYVSPVSGGRPVRAIPAGAWEVAGAPSWSPDGASLAVYSLRDGARRLAVIRVGSQQPPELLPQPGSCDTATVWSPDGRWIVCAGPVAGQPSLILVSPDGGNARVLPSPALPSQFNFLMVWSRDSSSIYVASSLGKARLDAVDVQTGKARMLGLFDEGTYFSVQFGVCLFGSLAPDGKSFVTSVIVRRSDLWIMEGLRAPRPWYARLVGLR